MKKVSNVVLLLLVPPLVFILINIAPIENYSPYWTSAAWGLLGAITGKTYSIVLNYLKQIKITDPLEIKIHNEQLRLVSTTTNAIALGLFGFVLLDTIKDHKLNLVSLAILFMLGVFIHWTALRILSFILSDKP